MGVRGALIAGLLLVGVAYALMLCVEAVPSSAWVVWLFTWWALTWVGAALVNVNSVPYAMHLAGDSAPRAFAVQSAVIGITSFAGSLVGAWLVGGVASWTGTSVADPEPFRIVLWLVPAAFVASGLAMLAARPIPRIAFSRVTSSSGRPPVGIFVLLGSVVLLFSVGEGVLRAFFNVYLDTRLAAAPVQIGLTMGLAQLLPVAASLAAPGLIVRFGTALTLALASFAAAAALVVLGAVPALAGAGAAYMAAMSMVAVHGATRNVFSQEIVAARWRTTSAAILTVGMGFGWAISAAVGGLLVGTIGFGGLFYLTGALAALGGGITWAYQRASSQQVPLPSVPELEHV
jgi:hypothetical protein